MEKIKAPRNRTIELTEEEIKFYLGKTIRLDRAVSPEEIKNKTINQDIFGVLSCLPSRFVDLLIIDPPYNLTKKFGTIWFMEKSDREYEEWAESWFASLIQTLKLNASVYLCCDWRCSSIFEKIAKKYLYVQNRITWEREKGRGAKNNWKNCSEDIWFFTMQANGYLFNVEDVKLKRKVLAPYTDHNGEPKDWDKTECGNFRNTYPSNIWTDISVPFWSMPENTKHPTQKPEKLIAKLILASSNLGDIILDPFLGSGTTSVVAKKLGRSYVGIEIDKINCCLTEKRLELANQSSKIQGYEDGVFWERNTRIY